MDADGAEVRECLLYRLGNHSRVPLALTLSPTGCDAEAYSIDTNETTTCTFAEKTIRRQHEVANSVRDISLRLLREPGHISVAGSVETESTRGSFEALQVPNDVGHGRRGAVDRLQSPPCSHGLGQMLRDTSVVHTVRSELSAARNTAKISGA